MCFHAALESLASVTPLAPFVIMSPTFILCSRSMCLLVLYVNSISFSRMIYPKRCALYRRCPSCISWPLLLLAYVLFVERTHLSCDLLQSSSVGSNLAASYSPVRCTVQVALHDFYPRGSAEYADALLVSRHSDIHCFVAALCGAVTHHGEILPVVHVTPVVHISTLAHPRRVLSLISRHYFDCPALHARYCNTAPCDTLCVCFLSYHGTTTDIHLSTLVRSALHPDEDIANLGPDCASRHVRYTH